MASLGSFLFGKTSQPQLKQLPTMNPEQQAILGQLLQLLGGEGQLGGAYSGALEQLQEMASPESRAYETFAQPYMQAFQQQTVPQLAERFAGLGGGMGGGLSSSGFGQALSAAGAGLQTDLASLKGQLQQSALKDILGQYQGMLGAGLQQRPFGYQQTAGASSPGLLGSALSGFSQSATPWLSYKMFGG